MDEARGSSVKVVEEVVWANPCVTYLFKVPEPQVFGRIPEIVKVQFGVAAEPPYFGAVVSQWFVANVTDIVLVTSEPPKAQFEALEVLCPILGL